ncbi:MSHA biogenesis protein MshK, partial [Vibrio parahaemolyticus]|nr:MSHA biogenesis protein MshK [Vibrio parahaemolyticus]
MVNKLIISLLVMAAVGTAWANQDPTAPLGWEKPAVETSAKPKVKRYRLPKLNSIVCKPSTDCIAIM